MHDSQSPTGDNRQPTHDLIRVLLVEDHERVREAVTERLDAEPDIEVIAAVATFGEAIESASASCPDVAVLDVELPDGNGIVLCQRILEISQATQAIIYTSLWIGPETAARAGAAAVVLKQLVGDELLDSIRKAAATLR